MLLNVARIRNVPRIRNITNLFVIGVGLKNRRIQCEDSACCIILQASDSRQPHHILKPDVLKLWSRVRR